MSSGSATPTRARNWPEPAQFNEAVQNLATSMSDRELQGGEAELGSLGVPMPYAGNFADVYKVHCPQSGNTWAVKFFKREVRDLRERYRAISEQLIIAQLPFTVDFRYIEEGVRINGAWYPCVKMKWIEGQSLNRFVAQSLASQPKMLDLLFDLWVKLAARLRAAGIAHADLQHGNVVLVPDEQRLLLRLIDYDGMFVPALADMPSSELGHPNYQHPEREATRAYNAELDRFSHLAICCALRCLSSGGLPLWEQFNTEDNLLFTAADFANPRQSAVFRELWTLRNPDAHALVGRLLLATQRPLEQSPLVEELVQEGRVLPLSDEEQDEAQSLLSRLEWISPPDPEAVSTTVESLQSPPMMVVQEAAAPVARIASPPPTPPPAPTETVMATEIVMAELVPQPSLWRRLVWPFALLDRLLGWIVGEEHALLHNFLRVTTAAVVIGAGPAIFYGKDLFKPKPPVVAAAKPVTRPVRPAPKVTPQDLADPDEEVNPEPQSEDDEPQAQAAETPQPTIIKSNPMVPSPTPSLPMPLPPGPATGAKPFAEVPPLAGGLGLLELPHCSAATLDQKTTLAQLHVDRPQLLTLRLIGADELFPPSELGVVGYEPKSETGRPTAWAVHVPAGRGGKDTVLARFTLEADGKLSFAWGTNNAAHVSALRYCLLELKLPGETMLCALTAPRQMELPAWAFSDTTGLATIALPGVDASSLPNTKQLRATVSLGEHPPFVPEIRKEGSTSAVGSGKSGLLMIKDPQDASELLYVKGTLMLDAQRARGSTITLTPSFLKRVQRPEGDLVIDPQATSASRLTKLRQECEAAMRQAAKPKKQTKDFDKLNEQLFLFEEKYAALETQMLGETSESKRRRLEKSVADLGEKLEKLRSDRDQLMAMEDGSVLAQTFAQNNRDRCDRAVAALAELGRSPLQLELTYELNVDGVARQLPILSAVPGEEKTMRPKRVRP
jgi:serine/threonine protein kinase